jgi:signal transduction histidine kinase
MLALTLAGAGAVFYVLNPEHFGDSLFSLTIGWIFPTVGALVASRRPENAIGWIFLAIGVAGAIQIFGVEYGTYGLITNPGAVPFPGAALTAFSWTIGLSFGLLITFALLLFPSGHLPSRRWRFVAWASAAGITLMTVGLGLHGTQVGGRELLGQLGAEGMQARGIARILNEVGHLLVFFGLGAAVISLFVRRRRASPEERQQLRWFALGAAILALAILLSFVFRDPVGVVLEVVGTTSIPIAVGIAILRYRLYDIDVVINRALVYGSLAAFITAVYVGVVVGIGNAIGARGEPNLGLQIMATALVAVAFQPVRARVQRFANRLVYGERATPYEVMAGFASRMAGSLEVDDVLPRMAEAAARGVGGSFARVRVQLAAGGERQARWPPEAPDLPFDLSLAVAFRGEDVGEIAVAKQRGERLRPDEESLLRDLAGQAGLALHNVRLTEELRARVAMIQAQAEAIRDSQRRIVTAAADERRRLERTLEERAEGRLEAFARGLEDALAALDRDPQVAAAGLEALQTEAQETLEDVRDLARGIFPPLLADRGLSAALDAQLRKVPIPVRMDTDEEVDAARYPEEVEAAVYFCSLEALRNAASHSGTTEAVLRLEETGGEVSFTVSDDGRGFDAGIAPGSGLRHVRDRVEALGGTLELLSAPGDGTTVTGRIPVGTREPVG